MGGSEDSTNIIELTIEEHAESHKVLWEQYGEKEDWLAWQGLIGMIDKKEIIKELLSIAGKKGGSNGKGVAGNRKNGAIANWEKNKDKILQVLRENGRKYGHLGGAKRDWIWINNEKEELKILKEEQVPIGWNIGRLPMSELTRQKIKNSTVGKINKGLKTNETKEKMSEWRKDRKWYHNPNTLESSQFLAGESIPEEWIKGRGKVNMPKRSGADSDLAKEVRDGGHDKDMKS